MARDDGVKIGAGGKVMLSEVPEVGEKVVVPLASKLQLENEKKKVEVLEERLLDVPEDLEEE